MKENNENIFILRDNEFGLDIENHQELSDYLEERVNPKYDKLINFINDSQIKGNLSYYSLAYIHKKFYKLLFNFELVNIENEIAKNIIDVLLEIINVAKKLQPIWDEANNSIGSCKTFELVSLHNVIDISFHDLIIELENEIARLKDIILINDTEVIKDDLSEKSVNLKEDSIETKIESKRYYNLKVNCNCESLGSKEMVILRDFNTDVDIDNIDMLFKYLLKTKNKKYYPILSFITGIKIAGNVNLYSIFDIHADFYGLLTNFKPTNVYFESNEVASETKDIKESEISKLHLEKNIVKRVIVILKELAETTEKLDPIWSHANKVLEGKSKVFDCMSLHNAIDMSYTDFIFYLDEEIKKMNEILLTKEIKEIKGIFLKNLINTRCTLKELDVKLGIELIPVNLESEDNDIVSNDYVLASKETIISDYNDWGEGYLIVTYLKTRNEEILITDVYMN